MLCLDWEQWAECKAAPETHRDAYKSGQVFLDKNAILDAPDLRDSDPNVQAAAWDTYRQTLIQYMHSALLVGVAWEQILLRLGTTMSDPAKGYPRIAQRIREAQKDKVLLKYPLLHADVLIYKLDSSYATGAYCVASVQAIWDRTTSRHEGEDPVSLAVRVIEAFLTMHESSGLTKDEIWEKNSYRHDVNTRYVQCLRNDSADPNRGHCLASTFTEEWERKKKEVQLGLQKAPALSCEFIAQLYLLPAECRLETDRNNGLIAGPKFVPGRDPFTPGGGPGARTRRDEKRLAAHQQRLDEERSTQH